MALNINTNTSALGAAAAASSVNKTMETSMERLSSGLRINTASDDAAGVAIASRMDAQIRGLNQAIRNAADGQALVDTTEGAHLEITNILQRMRELAVQSANDTNVSGDRSNLQSEVAQLVAEIDRIANQSTWNGVKILDGTFTSKQLQIGADQSQVLSFSVDSARSSDIGDYQLLSDAHAVAANTIDGDDLTINGHLGSATIAVAAAASAKDVVATINANTASTGVSATAITKAKLSALSAAESVAFTLTGDAAATISVTVASTSHLGDIKDAINAKSGVTGITAAFGDDTSEIVLTHLGGEDIAVSGFDTTTNSTTITLEALDRVGADLSTPDTATIVENGGSATGTVVGTMTVSSIKSFTVTGDDATAEDGFFHTLNGTTAGGTASLSAVSAVNIATTAGAANAIRAIDGALNKVNTARADLGAISNRLDNTIANLTNITTNVQSSQSRIQDADFAAESTNLAKAQILQQASMAMLAQANASKQGVLQLLQG
ncbi:MAG: flagellar filament protein [Marinibacterium sp.]|nr:flagellar filament protein [Marinibacterium sp.]